MLFMVLEAIVSFKVDSAAAEEWNAANSALQVSLHECNSSARFSKFTIDKNTSAGMLPKHRGE